MTILPSIVSASSPIGPSPIVVAARQRFRSGLIIAAIPVGVQSAIALLLILHAEAFPKGDDAVRHPAFWFMQAILIFIVIFGNTIVDFNAAKHRHGVRHDRVTYIHFCFCIVLVALIAAIIDKEFDWIWLIALLLPGLISLFLAYLVQLDLALAEVDNQPQASGT